MANKYMPRLNSWRVNDAAASVSSSPTEERKQRAREWNNQGLESEDAHSKLECFEKAVQLNPQNAVFMNNKGTALTKLGLREEAISCYDQAIELDEKYKEAYFWKGQSLHLLGYFEGAALTYDQAIGVDSMYKEAFIEKGRSLLWLGRYEEAISSYTQAIELHGHYKAAYFGKGVSLHNLGLYREASLCYDQAIAIDENDTGAYIEKGRSLLWLGRYEEAISCCDQAIALDGYNRMAYFGKGVLLQNLDRYQDAILCFDQAIELDGSFREAYRENATLLSKLGHEVEADKYRKAGDGDADALCELQSQYRRARQATTRFHKARVYGALSSYIKDWRADRHRLDIARRICCAIDHCHKAQVYEVLQDYIHRNQFRRARLSELRTRIVQAIQHVHKAQVYGALQYCFRSIERAVDHVENHILSARCPHCQKLISEIEWQRESVLQCVDCAEHFCTWCFEAALSEVDAEYCASKCAMEFESERDQREIHKYCVRRHREVELEEYCKTLSHGVKQLVVSRIADQANEKGVSIVCR